ncbi:hypothetical protein [Spiroplasma endosymbiont of Diplazon laetatorius]|uniref:hypothetical protein n=1 Tax=Spiroplasma endosymbiont of Diplazon laetatorius TaxID=3066322 RepID=UPI0030CAFFD6
MYYINLLNNLYSVYNVKDNFLIAQFSNLEDAKAFVSSLNGLLILNEQDTSKFNNSKLLAPSNWKSEALINNNQSANDQIHEEEDFNEEKEIENIEEVVSTTEENEEELLKLKLEQEEQQKQLELQLALEKEEETFKQLSKLNTDIKSFINIKTKKIKEEKLLKTIMKNKTSKYIAV